MLGKNIDNNSINPRIIKKQITELEGSKKGAELILAVKDILLKHRILSLNDIEQLKNREDQIFLNENRRMVESILYKKLERFSPNPKKFKEVRQQSFEQHVSCHYQQIRNNPKIVQDMQSRITAGELTGDQVLDLLGFFEMNKQVINVYCASYVTSPTDREKYYKNIVKAYEEEITEFKEDINQISLELSVLTQLLNPQLKYFDQPTYHSLFNGIRRKQKGNIVDIHKRQEERDLLADLIMSDESINDEEKASALQNISNANLEYEIGRWLGKKLNKHERRVLRVLRRIIYSLIQNKGITGAGKSVYEAEIALSRIYDEYGLVRRKSGSYDYKQTQKIQDTIFGVSTKGLHQDILFKHKKVLKTRFILQVEKIIQEVTIENKKEEVIQEQCLGIRIAMPHFLFVSESDASSYYYQDTQGFKRFMAVEGMSQSEAAFNIAEYLEWFLSSKLQERPLDLTTLLEEAGLQNRYKTHPKEVLKTVKKILDNMVVSKYLIKRWELQNGKYGQEQYNFANLRYELFIAGKSKCEIANLTSDKSIKNRTKKK